MNSTILFVLRVRASKHYCSYLSISRIVPFRRDSSAPHKRHDLVCIACSWQHYEWQVLIHTVVIVVDYNLCYGLLFKLLESMHKQRSKVWAHQMCSNVHVWFVRFFFFFLCSACRWVQLTMGQTFDQIDRFHFLFHIDSIFLFQRF